MGTRAVDGRARRAAAVAALALWACVPRPPAVELEVGPPIELTDDAHLTYVGIWTNTNVVRVEDTLYFAVQSSQAPSNAEPGATHVRALHVGGTSPGPFVRVWSLVQPLVTNHQHPSLARDGRGRVLVIANWLDPTTRRTVAQLGCSERPDAPAPAQSCGIALSRWFTDPLDPASWSADSTGLRMRMRNTFHHELLAHPSHWGSAGLSGLDFSSLYDAQAGIGYLLGEGFNQSDPATPIDGRIAQPGMSRLFYRLLGDTRDPANVDGPYLLVEGAMSYPAPSPNGGNVMPKGVMRLGSPAGRCRTLWVAWSARNQWIGSPPFLYFDTSLAQSDDCGLEFSNLAGTRRVRATDGIAWNDPAFRVIEADHGEDGQGGLAIHPDGTPWIVKRTWDGDPPGPTVRDPREHDRVHFADAGGERALPLQLYRCPRGAKGCRAIGGPIDQAGSGRANLLFSRDGSAWLLQEQPATYSASTDGGRSFGPRVRFGPGGFEWRMHVTPDAFDPDLAHVVIEQRAGAPPGFAQSRLFYVSFRTRPAVR